MREANAPQVQWHRSSHSSADGQCVEVAVVAGAIAVRDSKDLAGPELIFTRSAWVAFVEGLKCRSGGTATWAGWSEREPT